MAGNARYTAVLDACVLYPLAIADSLISIAVTGLFAAKWTTKIEEEWINALEKNRPDLAGKLFVRRDSMREAVPDWEISESAWSTLTECLELPDPSDIHVLAAAIAGHADCIVTRNHQDFPAKIMTMHGIDVLDPDQFIVNQWDLEHFQLLGSLTNQSCVNISTLQKFRHPLRQSGLRWLRHSLTINLIGPR